MRDSSTTTQTIYRVLMTVSFERRKGGGPDDESVNQTMCRICKAYTSPHEWVSSDVPEMRMQPGRRIFLSRFCPKRRVSLQAGVFEAGFPTQEDRKGHVMTGCRSSFAFSLAILTTVTVSLSLTSIPAHAQNIEW